MKKFYVSPAIEVTAFVAEDILTTSSAFDGVDTSNVTTGTGGSYAEGTSIGNQTVGSYSVPGSTAKIFIIK